MAIVLSLNGIPVETNGPSLPGRGVPGRNGLGRNDPEPYGTVAVTLACYFGNVRVPSCSTANKSDQLDESTDRNVHDPW